MRLLPTPPHPNTPRPHPRLNLLAGSVAGLIGKGGCDAFEANKDATAVVAALPEGALMQW